MGSLIANTAYSVKGIRDLPANINFILDLPKQFKLRGPDFDL